MSVMIQIRNVPDDVHRAAKMRAAREGMTLSDLALRALEREVARPTVSEITARIRSLGPLEAGVDAAALVREERSFR